MRSHCKRAKGAGNGWERRYVALQFWLLESPAYRSLKPVARSTLVDLMALYNGANNGELFLSVRERHGGIFPGGHARYVLWSRVVILDQDELAAPMPAIPSAIVRGMDSGYQLRHHRKNRTGGVP